MPGGQLLTALGDDCLGGDCLGGACLGGRLPGGRLPRGDCLKSTSFQTWRTNVLGKINSDKVRFLNSIEAPWYSGPLYKEDWVACDQIIMAVFLDESCVTSRKTYWVKYCYFLSCS